MIDFLSEGIMKKIIQGLLLLLLFTYSASSFAEEIKMAAIVAKPVGGMPKTGQTISYMANDDGAYQKGLPAADIPHYRDNRNGTITDNATGLMWVQDPSLCGGDRDESYPNIWASVRGVPKTMTWTIAITECKNLDYTGHNDWRLPNIKELMSIVDYSRLNPSIDPIFTNCMSTYYWSSTTLANIFAWEIQFNGGGTFSPPKTYGFLYARPVRGGRNN